MLRFDGPALVRQLVRALRGTRSQTALSRRLGYRSNVYYTWESGRREPSASELFRIVAKVGRAPADALASFKVPLDGLETPEGVTALLEALRGEARIVDVAARCGVTRQTAARWLRGDTEPRASQLLLLIEALTLRVVDFVEALVPAEALPEIAGASAELRTRRAVAFTHPWSQAILRQLETRAYARLRGHAPGWLARRLNIARSEEDASLAALEAAGLVRWDGVRWASAPVAVDTSLATEEERRRLKLHWADVGRQRLSEGRDGLFSWAVIALSRADYERLRGLHVRYLQSLRQLVEESHPSEVVAVANVQLFALE